MHTGLMEPLEPVFRTRPEPSLLVAIGLGAIVIVLMCTQLTYLLADAGPEVFGARSQVQYAGSSWVETESERVNSRTLLEPVAAAHNIAIDHFEAKWQAGQIPGTQILQFEFVDADPVVALSVVESVTRRYLAQAEVAASEPNPAAEAYRLLEAELVEELAIVEAEIEELMGFGASVELTALLQEKAAIRASVDSVRLAIVQRSIFGEEKRVPRLVTEPFVLSDPVGPLPARRAVFGFLGGSTLALGLGFLAMRISANRRELPSASVATPSGLLGA